MYEDTPIMRELYRIIFPLRDSELQLLKSMIVAEQRRRILEDKKDNSLTSEEMEHLKESMHHNEKLMKSLSNL